MRYLLIPENGIWSKANPGAFCENGLRDKRNETEDNCYSQSQLN